MAAEARGEVGFNLFVCPESIKQYILITHYVFLCLIEKIKKNKENKYTTLEA